MTKNKDPELFIKQFKGIFKKFTVPIENEKVLYQISLFKNSQKK